MSFPDPNAPSPLPAPFMPLPFPGGDVGGFWPQFAVNPDHSDSHSQHENVPPFKRPRNSENNPLNSTPFPPMNPKMNHPNLSGGKGTGHIFYKTRMCAKFLEGTCRNGEHCTFAHGIEDLREPPPNWQDLVREKDRGSGNWNDDQRIIQRMKICKRYFNGEDCPYGEKCTFLHERPMKFMADMARQRETSAISIGTTGHFIGSGSGSEQPDNMHVNANSEAFRVKPVFWKTKICSKWEMTGQCPFGERCHFAHGQSELKVPGGCIEAEPVANFGPIPVKPLSIPVVDPSPIANAPSKEEEDQKKILKWKLTKKINRIYADWIDDLTPPHDLPGNAEA